MKKLYFVLIILLSVFLISNAYAQTAALTNILNFAKFTAGNVPVPATNSVNITTATMYGGLLTVTPIPSKGETISYPGTTVWTIYVTNKGNATAGFTAKVMATNTNLLGGSFDVYLNNLANIGSIAPGGNNSFQVVVSNSSPALDGAWISYLVMVSNTSSVTPIDGYFGSDGTTWYGGDLGVGTNQSSTNANSRIYLQHAGLTAGLTNRAGFLTAIVSGPVLRISKSVESITDPSGLYGASITRGAPGSYVTYSIAISNIGGAAATNVQIIDTIATQWVTFVSATNGSYFSNSSQVDDQVTFIPYVSSNDRLPANSNDVIKITVMIK